MQNLTRRAMLFSMLIGVGAMSVGCVPYTVRYHSYATVTPPAPYVEVVGVGPGPGYIWTPGYWWWDGSTYIWAQGRWALPPAAGYTYVRSGWARDGGRYVFVRGQWVRGSRARPRAYVHPSPTVRVRPGARYQTVRPSVRVRGGGRGTVRVR